MLNYYHILGLSRKASQKEIKAAYRSLALRYHPDRNPDSTYAEERFKEISHAYQVLRDPTKKAHHDLMLAYEDLQLRPKNNTQEAYTAGTAYAGGAQRDRRYRRRPPASWHYQAEPTKNTGKHNTIATAWAFGIVFSIAVLVVGLSSYRSYQEELRRAEQTELAESIYEKAEHFYEEANYAYALELLRTINQEYRIPYDAGRLKHKVLRSLEEEANTHFENGAYKKAASYFQLLSEHQPAYNATTFAKLVSSYEMIPDYIQAIHTYERVIQAEPLTVEARNRMAALFFRMGKYQQALKYYRQASDIVEREYQNLYGSAYPLVVIPEKTPESHYQLHCGLGKTYTKLGLYEQAEKAFKWAVLLRPGGAEAHLLRAQNYWEAQETAAACTSWKKAAQLGSKPAAQMLKKHCRGSTAS